jgi:hypothetical protein
MIRRPVIFLGGVAATLAVTAIYHGPMGKADALAAKIERDARAELDRQEMFQVHARLERGPLRRILILSGPADDFQREALPEVMAAVPGVADVEWDPASLPMESTR